jgi:hypothetical protein
MEQLAQQPGSWSSNPGRAKRVVSYPKYPDWLCGLPSFLHKGYYSSLLGIELPRREVNYSRTHSADGKNEWHYTSTPPLFTQGVDRKIFPLFLLPLLILLSLFVTILCKYGFCTGTIFTYKPKNTASLPHV